ncbi:VWA domain-containing protein [Leptobacterium flavescens]|uniref:VWA domain-containing protein n=1 Tax=Leptobacterium flavescens TaxID=472055 RepID=A0A6P0UIT6_9FLAO|nr:VWA domain-containing protein [Leptobacterium flavescens]NER12897.1 VWA domain-containing protein [Leptobacterium flavescens]
MSILKLQCTILLLLFSVLVSAQKKGPPHKDLIRPITNGMIIHLDRGSPYEIKLELLEIDGVNYSAVYGNSPLGIKAISNTQNSNLFLLRSNGKIYPIEDLSGIFLSPFAPYSADYELTLNVDTSKHNVKIKGTIFYLTEETHLKRNTYNRVATGDLVLDTKTGLYYDDCGTPWIKLAKIQSKFHDPDHNVKFISPNPEGGEYETVKRLGKGENHNSKRFTGEVNFDIPILGTYNYSHTNNKLNHAKWDIVPHGLWGDKYNLGKNFLCNPTKNTNSTTLFLFDRSGSMASKGASGKSKIEEAKEAAFHSLNSMQNNGGSGQEAGFLTFSGSCIDNPTASQALNFSSDTQQLQNAINAIPHPSGGTPLKEAVDAATKRLQEYVRSNGNGNTPKLIVMSDGVSSCGKIRPPGVYSKGTPLQKRTSSRFASGFTSSNNFNSNTSNPEVSGLSQQPAVDIKYYTIGFDIKPGSEAERDLQYLARSSGGKYLNAQNEYELTRAFQRFFRLYRPKETSALNDLDPEGLRKFQEGVSSIRRENYSDAKDIFKELIASFPQDYNAVFNLALMYEANNHYTAAIEMFGQYLNLNPEAEDREWVLKQIELLIIDRTAFFEYTRNILNSDLEYLNLHFKKVQNGESISLAEEFKAFIREKQEYYKTLPELLSTGNRQLKIGAGEISRGLKNCTNLIKKDPENWDKNASPLLSVIYLNLERLIKSF